MYSENLRSLAVDHCGIFSFLLLHFLCWEFVKCTGSQPPKYLLAWTGRDTGYTCRFSRQQMKELMWWDVTASSLLIFSTEPKVQAAAWEDVEWSQRSLAQLCSKRTRSSKSPACEVGEQLFATCIYDLKFFCWFYFTYNVILHWN